MSSALAFELPHALEASAPPAVRDAVKLLVARRGDGSIEHRIFRELPELLDPGDLLVINTSATLPAAVPARRADGHAVELRFSTAAPELETGAWWIVELRSPDGAAPVRGVQGERIAVAPGAVAELVAPFAGPRLWLAHLDAPEPLNELLARHGRPIRYGYVPGRWPLSEYQTVYADEPGSAEMPSAGRPFTPELLTRLAARGVLVAPIVLHTGVSSPERHEPPQPERYRVPETTARLVDAVRGWGGRVIAVGTTVVRALESGAGEGWTRVVITPERGVSRVDGLITGWHEPEASHLQLLEAVAGPELLARSYDAALEHGYLWHEFGDSHLILP